MTRERRFGIALFILGLGNGLLALGNFVAGGEMLLVGLEALMAVAMAGIGYSFVAGHSELAIDPDRERLVTAATILIAAVGVVLAVFGFVLAVTA